MPKPLAMAHKVAPGRLGLNSQQSAEELNTDWCITASNSILDSTGRIAARAGTQQVNSAAAAATVKQIFQYKDASDNKLQIFAADNKIYKLVGSTKTDISGTITTPTDDNWKFQNFNGKCIGFQVGHAPIVLSTVGGSFADISLSGTNQPSTAAVDVWAAYGYLWVVDGTDLLYSDALDETSWNGVYDLTTVWTRGIDTVTSVAVFNNLLLVFGEDTTIVYANAATPSSLILSDILDEGCIARDSLAFTGNDLLFLSKTGVHSFGRLIVQKSSPLSLLSGAVKDDLIRIANGATATKIRGVYDTYNDTYLLAFPETPIVYVFNMSPHAHNAPVVTTWDYAIYAAHCNYDQTLYFGTSGGYVVQSTGYLDDVAYDGTGGSTYFWEVKLGNSSFAQELDPQVQHLVKILKDYSVVLQQSAGGTVTLKWAYDFSTSYSSENITAPSASQSQYGISKYGIATYGANSLSSPLRSAPTDEGKIVSLGLSLSVNGYSASWQTLTVKFKIGRMGL